MHARSQKPKAIDPWPEGAPSPEEVASKASYVGSAEHKTAPSPAGPPTPRSDASKCPTDVAENVEGVLRWKAEVNEALRHAIRCKCVGGGFLQSFPRYVWGWFRQTMYEARLTNETGGQYKAYPLEESVEWPRDREGLLGKVTGP